MSQKSSFEFSGGDLWHSSHRVCVCARARPATPRLLHSHTVTTALCCETAAPSTADTLTKLIRGRELITWVCLAISQMPPLLGVCVRIPSIWTWSVILVSVAKTRLFLFCFLMAKTLTALWCHLKKSVSLIRGRKILQTDFDDPWFSIPENLCAYLKLSLKKNAGKEDETCLKHVFHVIYFKTLFINKSGKMMRENSVALFEIWELTLLH